VIIIESDDIQILKDKVNNEKTAIAIGKFDGIHKGHQVLINKMLEKKSEGMKTLCFTFSPSPAEFFSGKSQPQITTVQEKRSIIEKMGVDILIEYPFNKTTASMEPETFIEDILIGALNAGFVVSGPDLSFGYKGRGDMNMLNEYSSRYGFGTETVDKIMDGNEEISSSLIKVCMENGEIEKINSYLGRVYSFSGIISSGNRIGRTIGFPTINIPVDKSKALPLKGVYYSTTTIEGITYNSITNIGVKPTIENNIAPLLETYIYDFDKDVYGKEAEVGLLHFVRAEQKFSGLDELKKVLAEDIEYGLKYFKCENN